MKKVILLSIIGLAILLNNSTFAQKKYELNSSQYLYVEHIYNQVKIAAQTEKDYPLLNVTYENYHDSSIAFIYKNTITFNYQVIDTSYKYIKDSAKISAIVAYILGHELSHYKHGENKSHFNCVLFSNEKIDSTKIDSTHKVELARDKEGHFYARIAGFRPNQIIDTFFQQIYPLFAKDDGLYPPKSTRLDSIKATYPEADRLYRIFEAANFLVLLNNYSYASIIYEYLITHFKSKEIYYNYACILVKEIEKKCRFGDYNLSLPIIIETKTTIKGNNNFLDLKDTLLLNKAIYYLHNVNKLDKNYKNGYIVEEYAKFLINVCKEKKDYLIYLSQITKLEQIKQEYVNQDSALLNILIGIIHTHINHKTEAISYFNKGSFYFNDVCKKNISELSKESSQNNPCRDTIFKKMEVSNTLFGLNNIILDTQNIKISYYVDISKGIEKYLINSSNENIATIEIHFKNNITNEIKINESIDNIESKFLCNPTNITTSNKIYRYFVKNKLLFQYNKDKKLVSWIIII